MHTALSTGSLAVNKLDVDRGMLQVGKATLLNLMVSLLFPLVRR